MSIAVIIGEQKTIMINFLHTFHPQAILVSFGALSIHWYGFLMVVGGLLGFALVLYFAKRFDYTRGFWEDLLLWFVVGAVIGARIYYVIYAWDFYQENLLDILKVWQGGLAVHGIMLGGFIATFIYCSRKKKNFLAVADLAVLALSLGQIIGRNGNYFNQEIFGLPTSLPWGIPIDVLNRPDQYLSFEFFHPTFIYEVLGSIVILGILLLMTYRRLKLEKLLAGNIFLAYLILYSALRFCLEFLRIDYSPLVFGLRWAQLFSIIIFVVATGFLIYRNFRKDRQVTGIAKK